MQIDGLSAHEGQILCRGNPVKIADTKIYFLHESHTAAEIVELH